MKLSNKEQELVLYVRETATRYGNAGAGDCRNPKTQADKRIRKLLNAGVLLLVGCGAPSKLPGSFDGGIGLIPADMFDSAKHTKLSL